ncbi:unnamed protein product [Peronospora farinosa]|uniref:Uncharacterized protein n=1 Tax=Peronospora farinosa TaxID=134698 RepID=A0ABN8C9I4_9STRA|nr:unnamed protein product [Peronospora farinosa]
MHLPCRCPRWLPKVPIVAATLNVTLHCLCDRLHWFQGNNPGTLLDEHKESDRAFHQQMQRSLQNCDDKRLSDLRADLRMDKALEAVESSLDYRAADFTDGERGSSYFFRSPSPSIH